MRPFTAARHIADVLNAAGYDYFGAKAKPWDGTTFARIYFGGDFLTIEKDGEIHNRKQGRARALSIGHPAVDAAQSIKFNATV